MPAQYPTGLNGWLYMSRAQYNAITPDAYTKYTVKDGDEVHEYLGDVEITAEDGSTWVTMAYYEVDQQAVHDVIDSIYDDVEDLKSWRTVTIAPWKADINTWKTSTVDPFISDIGDRVTALESTIDAIDLSDLDGSDPTSWKSTVNSAITALQSAVSALQSSAVTSSDIRVIDVVAEMPASPTATTLYIVEGST